RPAASCPQARYASNPRCTNLGSGGWDRAHRVDPASVEFGASKRAGDLGNGVRTHPRRSPAASGNWNYLTPCPLPAGLSP
ncbi:MAG: hypothetical protein ACOYOB_11860, partial [Myxococcota bacterium]